MARTKQTARKSCNGLAAAAMRASLRSTTASRKPSRCQDSGPKRFKHEFQDSITFHIGDKGVKFVVHGYLLRKRSARVYGRILELAGTTPRDRRNIEVLELQEMHPEAFNKYLRWLYDGTLVELEGKGTVTEIGNLVRLWSLAKCFRDHICCNRVSDRSLEATKIEDIREILRNDVLDIVATFQTLQRLFCDLIVNSPHSGKPYCPDWVGDEFVRRYMAGEKRVFYVKEDGGVRDEVYQRHHLSDSDDDDEEQNPDAGEDFGSGEEMVEVKNEEDEEDDLGA